MNKKVWSLLIVFVFLFSGSQAFAFDSTPPKVISTGINPTVLPDSGGSVNVEVTIQSNSGLSQSPVVLIALADDISRQLAFGSTSLESGNASNGTYTVQFSIPANQMPGKYQVIVYPMHDSAGNSSAGFDLTTTYLAYGTFAAPQPSPTYDETYGQSSKIIYTQQGQYDYCMALNGLPLDAAKIAGGVPVVQDCGLSPAKQTKSAPTPTASPTPSEETASPTPSAAPILILKPSQSPSKFKIIRIACISKKKVIKKLSGINPKCPAGFSIKK